MPAANLTPSRTRCSTTICAPVRRRGGIRRFYRPGSQPRMSAVATIEPFMTITLTDTPLGRTIAETATDIWNDSCNVDELAYAVGFGAVGATANPTIVVDNWKADPSYWTRRVRALAQEQPAFSERELAWATV